MISIHIKKTLKTYNGLRTLRIKKELLPGSICLVTGPSGAGKTTFLKILAGLTSADSGIIKINDITWLNTSQKINLSPQQRLAGFVFQDYALFPNMTVLQHMKYATQDEAWIKRLLITGQLQNFSTHKPAQLSGGQQQRLAILRALAIKPRLLLMDEPFSALDIQMKTELINNLRQLITEIGATTIIVSHNQQELNSLSDDELLIE